MSPDPICGNLKFKTVRQSALQTNHTKHEAAFSNLPTTLVIIFSKITELMEPRFDTWYWVAIVGLMQ